jgi:hypothetical protein
MPESDRKISIKSVQYALKKERAVGVLAEVTECKSLPCNLAENFGRSFINLQ